MPDSIPQKEIEETPRESDSMAEEAAANTEHTEQTAGNDLPVIPSDRYELLERLGEGSQGKVYKGRDKTTGELVAVKVFNFMTMENWKAEELLRREVETLQNIEIAGIPKYIDFIEAFPYAYLVESYMDGRSMKSLIETGFRPNEEQVANILLQSLEILKQLHSHLPPVIHRDIKPGNILIDTSSENLRVSIIDFGTVAAARQNKDASTFAGTAGYSAPEQLFGKASPTSDLYGLGASMMHLVTGTAPYEMELNGLEPCFEKYLPENISPWLVELLRDMVRSKPEDRPQNTERVIDYVREHIPTEDGSSPAQRKQKASKLKLLAVIGGGILGFVLISVLLRRTLGIYGMILVGIPFIGFMIYLYGRITQRYKLSLISTLLFSFIIAFLTMVATFSRGFGMLVILFCALVGVFTAIIWNIMK
ncbi:MAG: protein kinase, partial [Proteobacteria bacterium]|nr:protein kinase [Pseudomonadota bacterium]